MTLCMNCLRSTALPPTPVGRERGHQRDPIQPTVQLCHDCSLALVAGEFGLLHERYESSRVIDRGGA